MLKTNAKYVPETKTVYGQDGPAEGLADEMTDVVVYIKKKLQSVTKNKLKKKILGGGQVYRKHWKDSMAHAYANLHVIEGNYKHGYS